MALNEIQQLIDAIDEWDWRDHEGGNSLDKPLAVRRAERGEYWQIQIAYTFKNHFNLTLEETAELVHIPHDRLKDRFSIVEQKYYSVSELLEDIHKEMEE
ncbi:hypothetical protein WOSG25_110750 [Weissella oryzae SG25]|uniref:Uncharacterized protein n=1 Tax=Weissella oryzae (strain DSM 25784 / JCM 18191 / LMG 30913 / SG25) TaxID=1329250 RepID=A0A069CW32_WEIOS|nr:hypothetical protein [Weissella oryzae]GAK31597.1 hypothetical protein WOSG25_110750 [Weissella oryzae SG25]